MAIGDQITALGYNAIRDKLEKVLGTGTASYGYGQTLKSTIVSANDTITATKWNELRNDVLNARIHQTGVTPTVPTATAGNVVKYSSSEPNSSFDSFADLALSQRFNIGTGRSSIRSLGSISRTASWNIRVSSTVTVNFSSSNRARWFFNSGGKIRFSSSRTGGTNSVQNQNWTSLLSGAGVVSFGGLPFYSLTTTNTRIFSKKGSGAYANNEYSIDARCNVASNSSGTATQVIFTVVWNDVYALANDIVSGTLSLSVEELRASGPLLPSGSFVEYQSSSTTISAIT